MIECPVCGYRHGYGIVGDEFKMVTGKEGDFYKLGVKMERPTTYHDAREIVGCPNCGNVFMDGRWPRRQPDNPG